MPRTTALLLALVALCATGVGQVYWSDGFETYNAGYLCYQDPLLIPGAPCTNTGASGGWDGWFNNPIEAGVVVDAPGMGNGGSNKYFDVSGALGNQDATHPFRENATTFAGLASGAPYTTFPNSGSWSLRCAARVPSGGLLNATTGAATPTYFIVNNDYDNAGAVTNWSIQMSMNVDPGGSTTTFEIHDDQRLDGAGLPLQVAGIPYDTWFTIRAEICLDANFIQIFIEVPAMAPQLLSSGTYATAGSVHIANIDAFGNFGQLHYDDFLIQAAPCGPFEWAFNRPGTSAVLDGTPGDVVNGVVAGFGWGNGINGPSQHSVVMDSSTGPGEFLIVIGEPLYGRSNPVVAGINGSLSNNTLNCNLFSPGAIFLLGGVAPAFGGLPPALNFSGIPGGTYSAQLGVLNPSDPDGLTLSRGNQLNAVNIVGYLEPLGGNIDRESFEASTGWVLGGQTTAAPGTYGPNWQTPAPATNWTVDTAGTPSGTTGPGAAFDGANYLYCETSGAGGTANFIHQMIAPVTALSPTNLYFALHMWGATQGTLNVEQFDGTNWVTLATFTGDMGNAWTFQTAPLNATATSSLGGVQVRFNYTGGGGFTGDLAIDSILIGS